MWHQTVLPGWRNGDGTAPQTWALPCLWLLRCARHCPQKSRILPKLLLTLPFSIFTISAYLTSFGNVAGREMATRSRLHRPARARSSLGTRDSPFGDPGRVAACQGPRSPCHTSALTDGSSKRLQAEKFSLSRGLAPNSVCRRSTRCTVSCS